MTWKYWVQNHKFTGGWRVTIVTFQAASKFHSRAVSGCWCKSFREPTSQKAISNQFSHLSYFARKFEKLWKFPAVHQYHWKLWKLLTNIVSVSSDGAREEKKVSLHYTHKFIFWWNWRRIKKKFVNRLPMPDAMMSNFCFAEKQKFSLS